MDCICDKFVMVEDGEVFEMSQAAKGDPGPGVAPGGTTGQILAKASDEDYDTEWIDAPDMDAGGVTYDPTEAYDDGTVGKELTTINSALTSLQSVTEIIDTASGAIASFPDGSGLPMRSLVAQINPVQDLHGQSNPWPAGGGVNKYPNTLTDVKAFNVAGTWNGNSYTYKGLTFTCTSDNNDNIISITVNGTNEASRTDFTLGSATLPAGSYIVNGCPVPTSGKPYWIGSSASKFSDEVGNGSSFTLEEETTFSPPSQAGLIGIRIAASITCNNVVFKPMIRLSTVTDATFQPYSNECPITGWTGLSGQRTGVNQWDEEVESGYISADGGLKANAISLRSKNFCPCKGNVEYRFVKPSSYSITPNICWYDKNQTFISRTGTSGFPLLTSPDNASFFKISMWEYGTTYNHDVSINYPSTETSYHAYTSLPITCTWQTEAGTVYGVTVDVVTGVLTVEWAKKIFNGTESWWVNESRGSWFYCDNQITDSFIDNSISGFMISNLYKQTNYSAAAVITNGEFVYGLTSTVKRLVVKDTRFTTAEEFKASLATQNLEVVYKLAEPQTYQLTPQQIETLIGNNTVFVDTGSVSVTYQASIKGYIDKVLAS